MIYRSLITQLCQLARVPMLDSEEQVQQRLSIPLTRAKFESSDESDDETDHDVPTTTPSASDPVDGECDAPKPGGPLTTRQLAEYKWMSGYPTPLQKIGQSLLCTGSSIQIQNMYTPAFTCPKQSNICNIYPNMSKNAYWAHKPILIKSIIITILQLSPNNSIVDYTFILYKHILKSTILIHVMSKTHQATNRLLQNQPQNELSPRALSVPEK